MTRMTRRVLLAGCAALLAGCSRGQRQPVFLAIDITSVDWGRDFRLTDHHGRVRTLADFRGKVVMLFFGYTHCPDMCPTTLARMAAVVEHLGPQGQRVQGLFVTVDPQRDTPELLAHYVPAFHASFLGLRGDAAVTAETAKDFKVFYQAQKPGAGDHYTVDHMGGIFAFDPTGRLRLYIRPDAPVEAIAQDLQALLEPA